MITDSPTRYRRIGIQEGRDRSVIENALANASVVESQGLASVLTLKHLAWQSGASYPYLRKIVERREDPYTEILRRRKNGAAMRVISSPHPPLMAVQRWILRSIVQRMPVHPASHAYMHGDSVLRCATVHLGATWLIKMDVHDFFHSIDERQIFAIFSAAGYASLVSLEIARLCTRQSLGPLLSPSGLRAYTVNAYRTRRLGALPQGAPTSGPLANIAMRACDQVLSEIAASHDLAFTRYADDIVFSASGRFGRRDAHEIVKRAGEVLLQHGLRVHHGKTHIIPPGGRRIVLGLLIDGDHARLPKETRQRIRDHVRGTRVFGIASHSRSRGFASIFGFINHVNGLLAFAYGVEPEFATKYRSEWRSTLNEQGWGSQMLW